MNTNSDTKNQAAVKLHIRIPEDLSPAVYANHMTISQTPTEFVITFVQLEPLRDEVAKTEVREKGVVEAEAVANVVVSHQFLPVIVEVLQQHIERASQTQKEGVD